MARDVVKACHSQIQEAIKITEQFPYITSNFRIFLEELSNLDATRICEQLLNIVDVIVVSSNRVFDPTHPEALKILQLIRIMYNNLSEEDQRKLAKRRSGFIKEYEYEMERIINLFCMLTEDGQLPINKETKRSEIESLEVLQEYFQTRANNNADDNDDGGSGGGFASEDVDTISLIKPNISSNESVSYTSVQNDDDMEVLYDSYIEKNLENLNADEYERKLPIKVEPPQKDANESVDQKYNINRREEPIGDGDSIVVLAAGEKVTGPGRPKTQHCTICSQSFKTSGSLKEHLDTQHHQDISKFDRLCTNIYGIPLDEPVFLCISCVAAFESETRHRNHMKHHDGDFSAALLICEYCSTVVVNKDMMDKHLGQQGHGFPNESNPDGFEVATEIWCTDCLPHLAFNTDAGYFLHVKLVHRKEIFFFCKKCLIGSCNSKMVWLHIMSGKCCEMKVYERTLGMCVASELHFQPIDETVHRGKPSDLFLTPHNCPGRTFVRFGSRYATCGEVENGVKCFSLQSFFRYENYLAMKHNCHSENLPSHLYPPVAYVNFYYNMYAYLRFLYNQGDEPKFLAKSEKSAVKIHPQTLAPIGDRTQVIVTRGIRNNVPHRLVTVHQGIPGIISPMMRPRPSNPMRVSSRMPALIPTHARAQRCLNVQSSTSAPSIVRPTISFSEYQGLLKRRDESVAKIARLKGELLKEEALFAEIQKNINAYGNGL